MAFGGGGFVNREKRTIEVRGLSRYFRFMQFEANIAGAIKGVDAVVVPSLWEACPLLPMEVLTTGTPLIATDCIGLREVVKGAPVFQVPVRDAMALAAAIRKVMFLDSRRGLDEYVYVAADRYDVEKQASSLQALYSRLV